MLAKITMDSIKKNEKEKLVTGFSDLLRGCSDPSVNTGSKKQLFSAIDRMVTQAFAQNGSTLLCSEERKADLPSDSLKSWQEWVVSVKKSGEVKIKFPAGLEESLKKPLLDVYLKVGEKNKFIEYAEQIVSDIGNYLLISKSGLSPGCPVCGRELKNMELIPFCLFCRRYVEVFFQLPMVPAFRAKCSFRFLKSVLDLGPEVVVSYQAEGHIHALNRE